MVVFFRLKQKYKHLISPLPFSSAIQCHINEKYNTDVAERVKVGFKLLECIVIPGSEYTIFLPFTVVTMSDKFLSCLGWENGNTTILTLNNHHSRP